MWGLTLVASIFGLCLQIHCESQDTMAEGESKCDINQRRRLWLPLAALIVGFDKHYRELDQQQSILGQSHPRRKTSLWGHANFQWWRISSLIRVQSFRANHIPIGNCSWLVGRKQNHWSGLHDRPTGIIWIDSKNHSKPILSEENLWHKSCVLICFNMGRKSDPFYAHKNYTINGLRKYWPWVPLAITDRVRFRRTMLEMLRASPKNLVKILLTWSHWTNYDACQAWFCGLTVSDQPGTSQKDRLCNPLEQHDRAWEARTLKYRRRLLPQTLWKQYRRSSLTDITHKAQADWVSSWRSCLF